MELEKERLDIPYVKLKFHVIFPQGAVLPVEKVSSLRGGMGEMMLRLNCVGNRDCEHCRFIETCIVRGTVYTRMKLRPSFMQGNDSVGYLIECENRRTDFRPGDGMFFFLTLFGNNIVYFGQYLQAFTFFGMVGMGKHQNLFEIDEITGQDGRKILKGNTVNMNDLEISTVYEYARRRKEKLESRGMENVLEFHTPLCVKLQGKYLNEFSSEAIFEALFRRILMLDYFVENYIDRPEIIEYPEIIRQEVFFHRVDRFSSTQNAKITLRGIQGKVRFREIPREFLLCLLAGELLHIGKNSSFGFGRYTLS